MILLIGDKQIEKDFSSKRRLTHFSPSPSTIKTAARLVSFQILSICDAVYSTSGETIKSRYGINSVRKEVKYSL
jgi:hypothetical protein